MLDQFIHVFSFKGFLKLKWAKWKRVFLTRSVAMVPCVVIAILAVNVLDSLSDYINVEQSLLVYIHVYTALHAHYSLLVYMHVYMHAH